MRPKLTDDELSNYGAVFTQNFRILLSLRPETASESYQPWVDKREDFVEEVGEWVTLVWEQLSSRPKKLAHALAEAGRIVHQIRITDENADDDDFYIYGLDVLTHAF